MLYLNSALNPILYNLMSSKFRNGFLRLLGLKIKRNKKLLFGKRTGTFHTTSTNLSSSSHSEKRKDYYMRYNSQDERICINNSNNKDILTNLIQQTTAAAAYPINSTIDINNKNQHQLSTNENNLIINKINPDGRSSIKCRNVAKHVNNDMRSSTELTKALLVDNKTNDRDVRDGDMLIRNNHHRLDTNARTFNLITVKENLYKNNNNNVDDNVNHVDNFNGVETDDSGESNYEFNINNILKAKETIV